MNFHARVWPDFLLGGGTYLVSGVALAGPGYDPRRQPPRRGQPAPRLLAQTQPFGSSTRAAFFT